MVAKVMAEKSLAEKGMLEKRLARSRVFHTGKLNVVVLCLLPILLTGCFSEDYYAHRDLVSSGAGDAIAVNKAIQTIDPWPAYVRNTTLTTDGQRAAAADDRYRQEKVTAPQPMNTSNTGADPAGLK